MSLGGRNIRGRSCILINDNILIDFPPDIFAYKIHYGLNLVKVTDIFITHSHIDHLAPSELCYYHEVYSNRNNPDSILNVHGNKKVVQVINDMLEFDMDGCPECISLNLLHAFKTVNIAGVCVTPLPALHDSREDCFIYLIEEQNKRILLANDSGLLTGETCEYLAGKNLDIVALDCTHGKLILDENASHMAIGGNVKTKSRLLSQKSATEKTMFISHHFSHNGLINYCDFASIAGDSGFISSYDGMEINTDDL